MGFAWGDMGHSIVGAVAEENILPSTKAYIRGILGVEPLAVAATWPDHVRDDQRFGAHDLSAASNAADIHNFANYHFCEIPTGYNYASAPKHDPKDAYGAINGAIQILKDNTGKILVAEKMIALRYLIHLMGDIHQPLHVGNGYDIGGNVCTVRYQKASSSPLQSINMHAFWDDVMVDVLGQSYADAAVKRRAAFFYPDYIANMKRVHPEMFLEDAKKTYGAGTLSDWLTESQQLRESGIYPDDASAMTDVPKGQEYAHRSYCKWFSDEANNVLDPASPKAIDLSKTPIITADYTTHFTPIVEMQLLKAGVRLARILDGIAAVGATDSVSGAANAEKIVNRHLLDGTLNNSDEDQIFRDLQKAFHGFKLVSPQSPADSSQ